MSPHVHPNSAASWHDPDTKAKADTIRRQVLGYLLKSGRTFTCRQIAEALDLGFHMCSKRVTELVDDNFVVETGETVCEVTERRVRLVRAATPKEREELRTARRQAIQASFAGPHDLWLVLRLSDGLGVCCVEEARARALYRQARHTEDVRLFRVPAQLVADSRISRSQEAA